MQRYTENRFVTIDYQPNKALLTMTWQPATEQMTEERLFELIGQWRDLILKLKPRLLIVDTRAFEFPLEPSVQRRLNDQVFIHYFGIVEKHAVIISPELYEQVPDQPIKEEHNGRQLLSRYFKTPEEARHWFRED